MKTVKTKINGITFIIQEGLSFVQQNEIIQIIEDFIDLSKARNKGIINIDTENIHEFIKQDKKLSSFNFELSKYLLTHIVIKPKITNEMLDDPDDPNTASYFLLGTVLSELAMSFLGKMRMSKEMPKLSPG